MKYPVAHQLPSGAWHCRVRIRGRDVSITRETKQEAVAAALAVKTGIIEIQSKEEMQEINQTVAEAIENYIMARENVLSPATIRGYRIIQRNRFHPIMSKKIAKISSLQWQRIVNDEAKLCSAKTLKNSWCFLSSVIFEATGKRIKVRIPQVIIKDLPYLTYSQIPIFMNVIRGSSVEIPALLALSSLRLSEILALQWKNIDLEKDCIRVYGSAVPNDEGKLVYRAENKNRMSRRVIPFIIPQLRQAVCNVKDRKPDDLVSCQTSCTIRTNINKVCHAAGLPEVGVHGLRRSFASLAYHLNLPEEVTMRIGGWSNPYTMRMIYTKISEEDLAKDASVFKGFFENDHKNGHNIKSCCSSKENYKVF